MLVLDLMTTLIVDVNIDNAFNVDVGVVARFFSW
jgi:hypothetical protein